MEENTDDLLAKAEDISHRPAPLAPYWESQDFDDALSTSVRSLRSESERAALYDRLIILAESDEERLRHQALSRLSECFRAEHWEDEKDQSSDRVPLLTRIEQLLASVEERLAARPEFLEQFLSRFSPALLDPPDIAQIRAWLNRLDELPDRSGVPADALLAARILFGSYGATWPEAGSGLRAALDHEDETVRACAAYQIGAFCRRLAPEDPEYGDWNRDAEEDRRATEGMAPPAAYFDMIREKEIERPGVAGAFWNVAPTWTVDADAWLLTLLERAADEPSIGYFPCDLGFDAHERFSRNPAAIRRLLDAGRLDIALAAATEVDEPIEGMESLLMEIADNADPEVVRQASWTLAYNYNSLHPNGERLGFVRRYSDDPDCNMLLVFSDIGQPGVPYAVVLYPNPPRQSWTMDEAAALRDRVFPPEVRGEECPTSNSRDLQTWYRRGFVKYFAAGKRRSAQLVSRVQIGYRSDAYWNPIDGARPPFP